MRGHDSGRQAVAHGALFVLLEVQEELGWRLDGHLVLEEARPKHVEGIVEDLAHQEVGLSEQVAATNGSLHTRADAVEHLHQTGLEVCESLRAGSVEEEV